MSVLRFSWEAEHFKDTLSVCIMATEGYSQRTRGCKMPTLGHKNSYNNCFIPLLQNEDINECCGGSQQLNPHFRRSIGQSRVSLCSA